MHAVQVIEVKVHHERFPQEFSVGNKCHLFEPAELQYLNNVVEEEPQIWTNWSLAPTVLYSHDSYVSLLERNQSFEAVIFGFTLIGWME